jgi:hypothetical protein
MVSAPLIVINKAFVPDPPTMSVTLTVKLYVAAVVGVPEMTPVDALSDNPGGRAPADIDHVYGSVPPIAPRVW